MLTLLTGITFRWFLPWLRQLQERREARFDDMLEADAQRYSAALARQSELETEARALIARCAVLEERAAGGELERGRLQRELDRALEDARHWKSLAHGRAGVEGADDSASGAADSPPAGA